MMATEVFGLPAFDDNYFWIVRDAERDLTLAIDPGLAEPVKEFLRERKWKMDAILVTHHHWDHTGGVTELKEFFRVPVYGFKGDQRRIEGIDHPVEDGFRFELKGHPIRVLEVPGHTLGHIAYYFDRDLLLFVGDTLFGLGCGRLFEGSPAQMHRSLEKIKALPKDARVFCAHEYTLTNSRFAEPFMKHRPEFRERKKLVERRRDNNQPTVPFLLKEELLTNPFLNPEDPQLRKVLKKESASNLEVFTELRQRRNLFQ